MKGPTAPVVGSGDPASRSDWVVESTTSILRREPWMEVFEEHIRLPDGRLVDDFYTIRLRDFVVVAAVTEKDELVLVRHYRHGPRRVTNSLPSGFIDTGESPIDAARRELLEETGFVADRLRFRLEFISRLAGPVSRRRPGRVVAKLRY